ncbi:MAG: hypothetical protein R3F11_15385 [Verrucomicrobiales bacterium]
MRSSAPINASLSLPAGISPSEETRHGTRVPPSSALHFSPR